MDAIGLFLLRYRSSHPGISRELLSGLTDEQMR